MVFVRLLRAILAVEEPHMEDSRVAQAARARFVEAVIICPQNGAIMSSRSVRRTGSAIGIVIMIIGGTGIVVISSTATGSCSIPAFILGTTDFRTAIIIRTTTTIRTLILQKILT